MSHPGNQIYKDAATLSNNNHRGDGYWSVIPVNSDCWRLRGPDGVLFTPFEASVIAKIYREGNYIPPESNQNE